MAELFTGIPQIRYEGPASKNALAFKFYDAERIVLGKPMREHLPFAMAWWHNLCNAGKDMFGWLLGTGQARGIALVFLCASIIMLIIVLWAFTTKSYRRLADYYQTAPSPKVAN